MSEEPDIKPQDPQPMGEDWTTWTTTKRGGYVGGSTLVLHLQGLRYIGVKDFNSKYGRGPQIIYGYKGWDTFHEFPSLRVAGFRDSLASARKQRDAVLGMISEARHRVTYA